MPCSSLRIVLPSFLSLILLCGCVDNNPYQEPVGEEAITTTDSLAAILEEHFFARDFEGGVIEGESFLEDHYSSKLHAWYLLNLARDRQAENARMEALELSGHLPESSWSWAALAGAIHFTSIDLGPDTLDALKAIKKAAQLMPDDQDIQYLQTQILREEASPEDAIQFIDSLLEGGQAMTAKLLASRAEALYASANDYTPSKNQALIDSSFAVYEQARLIDSSLIDAYFLPGTVLKNQNRHAEAQPLFEKALAISPFSSSVRLEYAHAILGQTESDEETKHEEIRRVVDEALDLRPESPEFLYMAADLYDDIGDAAKRKGVEDHLLEIEPEGSRAEWTHLRRIRRFEGENREVLYGKSDSSIVSQYRSMLDDYTNRDWVIREDLIGEVYLKRFNFLDSKVSDEDLLEIAEGMAKYEKLNPHFTFYRSPIKLAERRAYFREAEAIVQQGFDAFREQVERRKTRFATEEEYHKALAASAGWGNDALGWIYFNEERLAEAEKHLALAYDLTEGKPLDVLLHLGKLYEKRYDAAVAGQTGDTPHVEEILDEESLYITAFGYYKAASILQTPFENPGEAALKALYTKRNGTDEGYEEFLTSMESDDENQRREDVLNSRISEPEQFKPFSLVGLDGKTYTNETLRGKVVAINVWSTTCGPCLWEMPELQKLHEKYQDDPEVLILTITRDYNPGDARRWIEEKGYTLPVLVDDGFLNEMNVRAYPFTWFLDDSENIAYSKTGWSKYLLEEFSWRIEDLR